MSDMSTVGLSQGNRPLARSEGLDGLRAAAALLVVMLHAAMPYLRHPLPGLLWPVHDVPSPAVDALFWWIEGCVMPLFFLMSGFLAAGLLERLGTAAFLKHRATRILGPMAFACVAILPFDFYVWAFGFYVDGRATLRQLRSLKFAPDIARNLWGFSHLWYLEYLFLCCVGLAAAAALSRRLTRMLPFRGSLRRAWSAAWSSPLPPWIVAAAGAPILWFEPNVVTGFQHSFFPVAPKFLYSVLYFAVGAALAKPPERQRHTACHAPWWLASSLPFLVVITPLFHRQQVDGVDGLGRFVLAAGTALFASTTSLGLFGIALAWTRGVSPAVKYVAEASFWVYLAHHPLVGLAQIALSRWEGPSAVKFALVTLAVAVVTLGSYELMVRRTWIGALLNGRRGSRTRQFAVSRRLVGEPSGAILRDLAGDVRVEP